MIVVTRMLSFRWSSIIASPIPSKPNLEALQAAPPAKGLRSGRLLSYTMKPQYFDNHPHRDYINDGYKKSQSNSQ